jgi:hypothetical protein
MSRNNSSTSDKGQSLLQTLEDHSNTYKNKKITMVFPNPSHYKTLIIPWHMMCMGGKYTPHSALKG